MRVVTNSKQKEICTRILANYIIAKDALIKADMPVNEYIDAFGALVDNTVSAIYAVGGKKELDYANQVINK